MALTYILGILISVAAGFLFIRKIADARLPLVLHLLLGLALGLGIDGTAGFYTHILSNQFNRWIPIGLVVLLICYLSFPNAFVGNPRSAKSMGPRLKHSGATKEILWGIGTLTILAVPLAISGHYYPLGGWDAWSCWNLKAKFIFLGHENWKDMLAPNLWRSNTQYPLLWPLINVWFWDLNGSFDQAVPMLNSIIIALLSAGVLLFGILEMTGRLWIAIPTAVLVTASPFNITLYTSQYSDSLLGLYLLSAFVCLLLAEKNKLPNLKILSVIFLGLMSFTKNEGLVAAVIAAALIIYQEIAPLPSERLHRQSTRQGRPPRHDTTKIIAWFLIAALPTVIFTVFIAPKNEAFVNGITSSDKPVTLQRLLVIGIYPWIELISAKWMGFWFLVLAGLILGWKKLWQSSLGVIGLTVAGYLAVVVAYYAVNTFFEIQWWLSTTLARILFALLPSVALWIAAGLSPKSPKAS